MNIKRWWFFSVFIFPLLLMSPNVVSETKTIILATDEWAPYHGKHLEQQGFFAEIAKEAFHRAGYDCQIKFVPWERAMALAKKGMYDGVLGAYYTTQREQYFDYSVPVSEDQLNFFWLKERDIKYHQLEDLTPYTIGTVNGYTYNDEFDRADYLNKRGNYDVESNLALLMKGRIDVLLGSEKVIHMLLNQNYSTEKHRVQKSDVSLSSRKLYILISNQSKYHEHATKDFNQALTSMEKDGTVDAILSKHGL